MSAVSRWHSCKEPSNKIVRALGRHTEIPHLNLRRSQFLQAMQNSYVKSSRIRQNHIQLLAADLSCWLCAGNSSSTHLLQAIITPAGPSAQTLIRDNDDGTYLCTFSASLANDYVVQLKLGRDNFGAFGVRVHPGIADPLQSHIFSPDFGELEAALPIRLIAGRLYEFTVAVEDTFGNKLSRTDARWVLLAEMKNSTGGPTVKINQRHSRYSAAMHLGVSLKYLATSC